MRANQYLAALLVITISLSVKAASANDLADYDVREIKLGMTQNDFNKKYSNAVCEESVRAPEMFLGKMMAGKFYGTECVYEDETLRLSSYVSPEDGKIYHIVSRQIFSNNIAEDDLWNSVYEKYGKSYTDERKDVGKLTGDSTREVAYGNCAIGEFWGAEPKKKGEICLGVRFIQEMNRSTLKTAQTLIVEFGNGLKKGSEWYQKYKADETRKAAKPKL